MRKLNELYWDIWRFFINGLKVYNTIKVGLETYPQKKSQILMSILFFINGSSMKKAKRH